MNTERLAEIRANVMAATVEGWYGYDAVAIADVQHLLGELDRAHEVIARYASHLPGCVKRRVATASCSCGLAAALRRLDGHPQENEFEASPQSARGGTAA